MLLYHALYAFASDASFKMSILQWRALVFGKKLVGLGSRERAHPPRHVLGNILCPQDAPMIPLRDEDRNTNTTCLYLAAAAMAVQFPTRSR